MSTQESYNLSVLSRLIYILSNPQYISNVPNTYTITSTLKLLPVEFHLDSNAIKKPHQLRHPHNTPLTRKPPYSQHFPQLIRPQELKYTRFATLRASREIIYNCNSKSWLPPVMVYTLAAPSDNDDDCN